MEEEYTGPETTEEVIPQPADGEPSDNTEDTGAEPAQEEPTGEDAPAEPHEKEKGVQKRIDELTRKRREAERDAEYWKAKATGQEGTAAPSREEAAVIPANFPGKPNADQFDDYGDYLEALADWKTDYKLAQREIAQQQASAKESQRKALLEHEARVAKAKETYPDFDDVVDDARDIVLPNDTLMAIIESDHSADLVFHLAKNKDVANRIAAMSTQRQLIEIGKIEAQFDRAEKPVKRITKAPEPVTPVGNKETVHKSPDDMSDDEWLEFERKRLAKMGRKY